MSELATALGAVAVVGLVAVVRVLWNLADRVARLEGRLNGGRGVASRDERGTT